MKRRTAYLCGLAVAVILQLGGSLVSSDSLAGANDRSAVLLPKLLLWNASASVPLGLYWLQPIEHLQIGELVVVNPPKMLAHYMARRGYLPDGVPLLKHIAALSGQIVCRLGRVVATDGRVIAYARARDTHGRPLPVWQGCRRLREGEVFLLNEGVPDSFDGRYFGVLPASTITARATPLWTIPEH